MKKKNGLLAALLLSSSLAFPASVHAEEAIKVFLNHKELAFEVAPSIENGTTLVPFRTVFESLGLSIRWDPETETVIGSKSGLEIKLKIGDKTAFVNGSQVVLEVAPSIVNGSTVVPLRFIAESADGAVDWSESTKSIHIATTLEEKLFRAVTRDDAVEVEKLIKQGANVNAVDYVNRTALEWAILNPAVYKILLDGGADPNKKDELGKPPLHQAIMYGQPEIVKLLIEAKADLSATNSYGETPLKSAQSFLQSVRPDQKPVMRESVELLTKAGAPVDVVVKGELSKDGVKYVGDLVNGVANGFGKLTVPDGSYYEGQFVNGSFEGLGTFVSADKSKYVGEFKNGTLNGFGTVYFPSGAIGEQGEFKDGKLVKKTNDPATRATPAAPQSNSSANAPTGSITNTSELRNFLQSNFSTLNTSMGTTSFTFSVVENNTNLISHDYWIMVDYDLAFFNDVSISNKISEETRNKVKQELKDHQERIGKAVIAAMPNKKFDGGYYKSWYRYPNLKVDLISYQYYSWNNYDGFLTDGYEKTKPSTFRWAPLIDKQL